MQKLIFFILVSLISEIAFTQQATRPKYCCYYCGAKAFATDRNGVDLIPPKEVCTDSHYEGRNSTWGTPPPGFSTGAFASYCHEIQYSVYGGNHGNGTDPYYDAANNYWQYANVTSDGQGESPIFYVVYCAANGNWEIEIPLLFEKIPLFNLSDSDQEIPDSTVRLLRFDGMKLIVELRKDSIEIDSISPILRSWTYNFQHYFEDVSTETFTTYPNPFSSEVIVTVSQTFLNEHSDLKVYIKEFSGTIRAEETIYSLATNVNTTSLSSGSYILFIYSGSELIDYKYIVK